MRLANLIIVAFLLLLGCEGSDGVADGGVPPGRALPPRSGLVIVEEPGLQPTELARALCAKAFECANEELGALTESECALYFSLPCFFFGDIRAEDGLTECLAEVRAARCEADLLGEACEDAFVRSRARLSGFAVQDMEGGACGNGVQCGGGMACDNFGSGECGQCIDGPRIGDACDSGCWEGYCDLATNVCTRAKANGETCAADEECDDFNCSAAGVCKPSDELTECSIDDDCNSGHCVSGNCTDQQPPGGTCSDSSQCDDDGFCHDGVCKLVARCSFGEAGEPCGPLGCAGNFECVHGVCVAPPNVAQPNGASCSSSADCASGFCGFGGGGSPVCSLREVNQPCDSDAQCASGTCSSFRCTSPASSASCVE